MGIKTITLVMRECVLAFIFECYFNVFIFCDLYNISVKKKRNTPQFSPHRFLVLSWWNQVTALCVIGTGSSSFVVRIFRELLKLKLGLHSSNELQTPFRPFTMLPATLHQTQLCGTELPLSYQSKEKSCEKRMFCASTLHCCVSLRVKPPDEGTRSAWRLPAVKLTLGVRY